MTCRGRHISRLSVGIVSLILLMMPCLASPAHAETIAERFAADPVAAEAALDLARQTFEAWALRHERLPVRDDLPPLLRERGAIFVSAVLGDAPRCCMGTLYPTRPTLAEQISEAALAACRMDLRFRPITPQELPRLRVIVSVLEPPEPIADARGLDPARDGLAVRSARGFGVVLPLETPRVELIEPWARIRAGASPDEPVDYYRVRAFRIVEPEREP